MTVVDGAGVMTGGLVMPPQAMKIRQHNPRRCNAFMVDTLKDFWVSFGF
jgi:hypothetical protein